MGILDGISWDILMISKMIVGPNKAENMIPMMISPSNLGVPNFETKPNGW
jgi:hypothetical protein